MKIVKRGWGIEAILVDTPTYNAKILVLAPSARMSLHYHKSKDETLVLIGGKVFLDAPQSKSGEPSAMSPFVPVRLKPRVRHSLFTGDKMGIMLEVSDYADECDTHRVRDGDSQQLPEREWPAIRRVGPSWPDTLRQLVAASGQTDSTASG